MLEILLPEGFSYILSLTYHFSKEAYMIEERRNLSRRTFSYYMRVMDEMTGESVGHLADISTTGFKLDSKKPLPANVNLKMRIEQTGNIADKNFVVFTARTKWCKRNEYDVSMYNIGFQLTNISQTDYDIFIKMFDTYGVQNDSRQSGGANHMWR
jgi:hypothetical protein